MIWQEITITTIPAAADAVANLFHEMGFGGVVIEDPQLIERYTRTAGWDCYELPPEVIQGQHISVKGYFPLDQSSEAEASQESLRLAQFRQRLQELLAHFADGTSWITLGELNEEDWAHAWKKYYHPVQVSKKIVIKPTWETYTPGVGEIVIELDPGMAFGTGTHPTTIHCLRALEQHIHGGERVVDVGTGTGILAIAAVKLGAAEVIAVDLDPMVAGIARENISLNGVEAQVKVLVGDLWEPVKDQPVDLIVGNLVAGIVKRLGPSAWEKLRPGGYLIGAGIIQGRLEEVLEDLTGIGFELVEITEEGEWSTVIAQKGQEAHNIETITP
ncbi:MAG: 50S ribosomal protein L11 methyltransferase [Syntrophomonadaceae bacterium]|nr:50S ribosomal protein L11 methyltransferase [Syntrophomonadaceae bacterium]